MKRRIILMGGKTHVVSIPSEYVRKYDLRKGDELLFEEKGSEIIFRNQKAKTADFLKLELKSSENIDLVLKSLYERGYDDIELAYIGIPSSMIESALTQLPGFELVNSSSSKCTIRCVSSINPEDFENMLRRLFFMIRSIPESISQDNREAEAKISSAKRLSVLCKRSLSKKEFGGYGRTLVYYSLLNEIEDAVNCYSMLIKEKGISFKEISKAAEIAYDALYKKDSILENVNLSAKNSPSLGMLGLGLGKIAIMAQGLKMA